jgi:hypothetical protein
MRKKFTEDELFKTTTSALINFMVYLNEEKNQSLKYTDILEFQQWMVEKAKQFKQDGEKSI